MPKEKDDTDMLIDAVEKLKLAWPDNDDEGSDIPQYILDDLWAALAN